LFEELLGAHKTPRPGIVVAANIPWLLMPWAVIARLNREHPFSRAVSSAATSQAEVRA
jgi:hypothetical protein